MTTLLSSPLLDKRELIALEILKSLVINHPANAVKLSFDLADEFLTISQSTQADTANVTDQLIDIANGSGNVTVEPTHSANPASSTNTPPAIPVFSHDYPKTRRS